MDLGKDLQTLYISSLQAILEDKFSAKFDIRHAKQLETDKCVNDIAVNFELQKTDSSQIIYFFMDRKFTLNLIQTFINEVDAMDLGSDFTVRIVNEVNNLILKKKLLNNLIINKSVPDKTDNGYSIGHTEIIKGYGTPLADGKVTMGIVTVNSNKGDLSVGFLTPESLKTIKEIRESKNRNRSSKKSFSPVFQGKENDSQREPWRKDDFQGSGSIISTVQLLEIKRVVLSNLNEIKDLRGDSEFLLRKAKAVTELSKLWFDILKEEQ